MLRDIGKQWYFYRAEDRGIWYPGKIYVTRPGTAVCGRSQDWISSPLRNWHFGKLKN